MKKMNHLALWAALLVVVSACSKPSGNYSEVIPVDATTLVALNLHSMAGKSGINDQENETLKEKIIGTITSGLKPATVSYLEKIMESPDETGLSFKEPVYVFMSPSTTDPVVAIKVVDTKKIKTFLNMMVEEQMSEGIVEKDGYNFMDLDGAFIAYNNTAFIAGGKNRNFQDATLTKFLNANEAESIHNNEYFQKLQNKKGDIRFFISLADYSKESIRQFRRQTGIAVPENLDLQDCFMIGDLSFEKGKAVSQLEFVSKDEKKSAIINNISNSLGKINGSFLADFPVAPLVFATINMNGEAMHNALMEIPEINQALQTEGDGILIQEFIKSFKGDVSVALLNVNMTDMARFVAIAQTNKNNALDVIYENKDKLGLRRGEEIIKLSPQQYQFRSTQFSFYFGIKDNRIYITNDVNIHKGTSNFPQTLKDVRYVSNITGKSQFLVIDIEAIFALPIVKLFVNFSGQEFKTYMEILSKFSYLEATSVDGSKTEIVLHSTDKDTNSLKQILEMAKQFMGYN